MILLVAGVMVAVSWGVWRAIGRLLREGCDESPEDDVALNLWEQERWAEIVRGASKQGLK